MNEYDGLIDPDNVFLLIQADNEDFIEIKTNLPEEEMVILLEDTLTSMYVKMGHLEDPNSTLKEIRKDLH